MIAPTPVRPLGCRLALVLTGAVLVGASVQPTAHAAGRVATEPGRAEAGSRVPTQNTPHVRRQALTLERRLVAAEAASEVAGQRVARLTERTAGLAERADRAASRATTLYASAMVEDRGVLEALVDLVRGRQSAMDQAIAAQAEQRRAEEVVAVAVQALTTARRTAEAADNAWSDVVTERARVETRTLAQAAARVAMAQSEFRPSYEVQNRAEDRRNRAALARWQRYLAAVADTGLTPPRAAELADPEQLADPLQPLRAVGRDEPGLAQVERGARRPLPLLPRETVRAVSAAFSRVGQPNVAGAVGSDDYSCGGLLSEVWARAGTTLPADSAEQWETLQTVRRGAAQLGDAVYLGDDLRGIHRAGIYVGNDQMLAADPVDGAVSMQPVTPESVYGFKRVTLPEPRRRTPAPRAAGIVTGCGELAAPKIVEPPVPVPVAPEPERPFFPDVSALVRSVADQWSGWVHPMAEGSYSMSAVFGREGSLWSSGKHTGQDFAAAVGTPVYAARAGVVTVENPAWAGNLVRIDHGDGLESWYAHLSAVTVQSGQQVSAGQRVGSAGSEGNSTGSHLHFEIRDGGVPVDPMSLLP